MPSQSWASGFDDTHSAAPAFAGQATFGGCLAVVPVDRRTLQSRLPPSISLPQGDADECPCLLVFGEQADGKTFFGGLTVPWGLRYHELMLAIPFARCDRGRDHLFVSGTVCDFWPAVWNGNTFYGFSKRFAPMSWDGTQFFVKDDDGGVAFCGALEVADRTSGKEVFAWIQSAAALPVLGVRGDGVVIRTRFEWDFGAATVEPAALHLTVGKGFDELLLLNRPFREDGVYRVAGMQWRLGWPDAVRANRP
jgi:hypothetical protein